MSSNPHEDGILAEAAERIGLWLPVLRQIESSLEPVLMPSGAQHLLRADLEDAVAHAEDALREINSTPGMGRSDQRFEPGGRRRMHLKSSRERQEHEEGRREEDDRLLKNSEETIFELMTEIEELRGQNAELTQENERLTKSRNALLDLKEFHRREIKGILSLVYEARDHLEGVWPEIARIRPPSES